jgi:hypothetical protein
MHMMMMALMEFAIPSRFMSMVTRSHRFSMLDIVRILSSDSTEGAEELDILQRGCVCVYVVFIQIYSNG